MDPYSTPENHGLTLLHDMDIAGAYEFEMLAVWKRNEDGALFYEFDSGCSCPSPFEWAKASDLTPLTDAAAFAAEVRKWLRDATYRTVGGTEREAAERIIRSVRGYLRRKAVKGA